MAAASAAAGRAAPGGPNPSGDGPQLRSPPGKAKPVALADITNTGRGNPRRSVTAADILKENARLIHLLSEKTKVVEASSVMIQKLQLALQASRQQNMQLAQANSKMLAELNIGKERLKTLQHDLSCTAAVLKVKTSEFEGKNKTANRRKGVKSLATRNMISKVVERQGNDSSVAITNDRHLVDSQCKAAMIWDVDCQEPRQDPGKARVRNKRKSESTIDDTNICQDNCKPHLQPVVSLGTEDPRAQLRRRSARLNPGSCEVSEVSQSHEDDVVLPSSSSVQKQHGPITGKDLVHEDQVLMASNLEEIKEEYSSFPRAGAHEIGGKAGDTKQSHQAETQSSLPFDGNTTIKHVEGRRSMRRAAEKVVSYKEIPLNVKMRRP
ncbi:hypothetical protein ACP4OV_031156 [Aristida adscensionis]